MARSIRVGFGAFYTFQGLHSLEIFDTLFNMTKKKINFFSWNFTENKNEKGAFWYNLS